MKYSIPVKFVAILLTALALAAAFCCILGIVQAGGHNLYTQSFESWSRERLENQAEGYAAECAINFAVSKHTNCTQEELQKLGHCVIAVDSLYFLPEDCYHYTVSNKEEQILHTQGRLLEDGYTYTYTSAVRYPVVERAEENTDLLYGADYVDSIFLEFQAGVTACVRYYESPEYTVQLTVLPDALMDTYGTSLKMVELLYQLRYTLIGVLAASLLVFAVGVVYLCCAAGKSARQEEVAPAGLNRLPLDLYLLITAGACLLLGWMVLLIVEDWYYRGENFNPATLTIFSGSLLGMTVFAVGFGFACAAQFKCRNLYWWKHSVIGWTMGKLWAGLKWVAQFIRGLFQLLPLVWQWILIGAIMGFMLIISVVVADETDNPALLLLVLLGCIAVVLYGAYAFGTLLTGAKRMADGDLNTKIKSRFLTGAYAQCAGHLNALADVAVVAAKKQMKSERMKTELITNVSHDIKTPLTSIINYVDLLQKPHTPEEETRYLEVLNRQSQRMKKLIEDLMEMSKATTGNMTVEIGRMDISEAVNQALGEFADKLAAVSVTPVFRKPEQLVEIMADGRITWRVLSNILSNVVKYALPGTRLYLDLMRLENQVVLSVKNISREELNVSADELTERFARGDESRNTEGSGLGLNIAKSLMELQKGQLQLLVDGDLFKVTLIFVTPE